jgi:hypothetical protein
VTVKFADNPDGSDFYDVVIAFQTQTRR